MRAWSCPAILMLWALSACDEDPKPVITDADADGWTKDEDCDDENRDINPGAREVCNGFDDDCDGTIDGSGTLDGRTFFRDADGDGVGGLETTRDCAAPPGYVEAIGDCDDGDPSVYPGAPEVCDGKDNDCDDSSEAEVGPETLTWYRDNDADGAGNPDSTVQRCTAPAGYVENDLDCNDARGDVSPFGPERCDPADNDCDPATSEDEAVDVTPHFADADGDGFGAGAADASCTVPEGRVLNDLDCDDARSDVFPGAQETCDPADEDCDPSTPDTLDPDLPTFFEDADGDGYGDEGRLIEACSRPAGAVSRGGDCDDSAPTIFPGAPEVCDGLDNDCDPLTPDAGGLIAYPDGDGDGFGDPEGGSLFCDLPPPGFVRDGSDCDDGDPATFPGARERCDGLDNDCDPLTPDEGLRLVYFDADGDGFGEDSSALLSCEALTLEETEVGGDCDDGDDLTYPGAEELCDGLDNDCDPLTPDPEGSLLYPDLDGDGFGEDAGGFLTCRLAGPGESPVPGDCDDDDDATFPGAEEACDGLDNDCDPLTPDEGLRPVYFDGDGDGFGEDSSVLLSCEALTLEETEVGGDCDDGDDLTYPGAEELCDGLDNDCDPLTPDPEGSLLYPDLDGDGFGEDVGGFLTCRLAGPGESPVPGDCDDALEEVNPDAPEVCGNDRDDDCDGTARGCGLADAVLTEDAAGTWVGSAPGGRVGAAFAAVDQDDDGAADLWVGAPGEGASGVVHRQPGPVLGTLGPLTATARISGDGAFAVGERVELTSLDGATVGAVLGGTSGVRVLPAAPSGAFSVASAPGRWSGLVVSALAPAGDLNGDGRGDIWVGGEDRVVLLPGPATGTGNLLAAAIQVEGDPGSGVGGALAVADWDGDGLPDLASTAAAGVVVVSGPFSGLRPVVPGWTGEVEQALGGGDLDGDGDADLVVATPTGPRVLATPGLGGDLGAEPLVEVGSVSALALGDLDGDGQDDLALVTEGQVAAFAGPLSSGTLEDAYFLSADVPAVSLRIADADGDGVLDLWVGSPDEAQGRVRVLLGGSGL